MKLRAGGSTGEFLDLTGLVGDTGGEEGLLALAVAPDYATSGRVFAFYTDNGGDLQLDEFRRTERQSGALRPIHPPAGADHPARPGRQPQRRPAAVRPRPQALPLHRRRRHAGRPGGRRPEPGLAAGEDPAHRRGRRRPRLPPPRPPRWRPTTTAPRLRIRVTRRQRVLRRRGIIAWARCSEACTITGRGTLRIAKRRYPLRRAARAARLGSQAAQRTRPARLKVRLTRRSARALRRAVRRGRRPLARIRLRATDAAGNRSRVRRAVVRVKVRPRGGSGRR